jgi:hypothetical protein
MLQENPFSVPIPLARETPDNKHSKQSKALEIRLIKICKSSTTPRLLIRTQERMLMEERFLFCSLGMKYLSGLSLLPFPSLPPRQAIIILEKNACNIFGKFFSLLKNPLEEMGKPSDKAEYLTMRRHI